MLVLYYGVPSDAGPAWPSNCNLLDTCCLTQNSTLWSLSSPCVSYMQECGSLPHSVPHCQERLRGRPVYAGRRPPHHSDRPRQPQAVWHGALNSPLCQGIQPRQHGPRQALPRHSRSPNCCCPSPCSCSCTKQQHCSSKERASPWSTGSCCISFNDRLS